MDNNISEEELRSRFVDKFKYSQKVLLYLEVPAFSRSVDLVMQNVSDLSIMAIEFKIHDWKRAILQAQSVALCFDYLSICLPKPKTLKGCQTVINACKTNGVGLYFYNTQLTSFEKILSSPKTKTMWEAQKKRIIGYLEAKSHERCTSDFKI